MALDLGELYATVHLRGGDKFRGEVENDKRALRDLDRQADGSSGRIGGLFAGLTGALGKIGGALLPVGLALAKFGAAVPIAAGAAAALLQIAPAAGVAATAILGAGLAVAAFKIGMSGVSDAASAALDPSNPEAYAAALKKLSPTAREFVQELHALQPALAGIKTAVQDRLFKNLGASLKTTAAAVLPDLKRGLVDAAGALNGMAFNAMGAARSLAKNGTLGTAIGGATAGLKSLTKIPSQIITAFVQVAAAAAPTFKKLTAAAGGAATSISQKLSAAFKSGAMEGAIDTAVGLLKQLANVAKNVFTIVKNVFGAAEASGGGFVGTLEKISKALADVSANPAFQQGLRALFQTMSQLATTAAPLLGQVLLTLGPVLTALGPPLQVLIQQLGVALQPVIAALGPGLVAMATSFGAVITAVAPLLPVLGRLVAGILTPLAPMLGFLAPAIVGIAGALRVWAAVQGILNVVLAANPIGLVVIAIGALAAGLIYAYKHSKTFRDIVNNAWAVVKGAVAGAWGVIRPILVSLQNFFTNTLAPAASALATGIGQAFTTIKDSIGKAWDKVKETLGQFVGFLETNVSTAISNLVKGIDGIGESAQALPGKLDGLKNIGSAFNLDQGKGADGGGGTSSISTAFTIMINRIKSEVGGFFSWMNSHWGGFLDGVGGAVKKATGQIARDWSAPFNKIIDFNADFFALMTGAVTLGIRSFVRNMLSPWPALQAKWSEATQGIPKAAVQMVYNTIQAIGKLPGLVSGIAARTWNSLPRTLEGSGAAVSQKLTALKGTIIRAFAGAPGWLRAAGSAIIDGLMAGINGKIGGLFARLSSIASSVKGIFSRVLDSHSPSRVMVQEGTNIIDGLIVGVTDGQGPLNTALTEVAKGTMGTLTEEIERGLVKAKGKLTELGVGEVGLPATFKKIGASAIKSFVAGLSSIDTSKIKAAADKLADAVRAAFKGFASKTKIDDGLLALISSTNKKLQKLADQRQKIADKLKEALDFAASVQSGAVSFASALGLKFLGEDGEEVAPKAASIIDGLKGQLTKLRSFGADIATLVRSGLSPTVLRQLLEGGPEQASAMASAIAQGGANAVAEINAVQGQIDASAKQLGEVGADYLYDAGAKAGNGFLTGLTGELDRLEGIAEDLATALLNAVNAGIAKAQAAAAKAAKAANLGDLTELAVTSGTPKKKITEQKTTSTKTTAKPSAKAAGFHIENYHEAPGSSARATAEQVLFLAKARG